eukprot:XP_016660878.1 PREDICTED: kelch-like protein 17 [Acyrthosiphon pisum]
MWVCTKKAFYYDPKTDFGQLIGSLNTDISTIYSVCSFNNQLYTIGACYDYNNSHCIALHKYNPQTNTWIEVHFSKNSSRAPGVVVLKGELYLMGGENNNYINIYEPKSNEFLTKNYIHLNSSVHYNTQAFVIDTKMINICN